MKKLILFLILFIPSSGKIQAQDVIVLLNGEQIKGDIIYEKPLFYKKNIQGEGKIKYGTSAKIYRKDIQNVIDGEDPILIKGFGNVRIWTNNETRPLTRRFYAANKTSISVIDSTYRSDTERKQYHIKDFPISHIDKIIWKKGDAYEGTLSGAGLGLFAGGAAGWHMGREFGDEDAEYVAPVSLIGLGIGAFIGMIADVVFQKSEKIPIN